MYNNLLRGEDYVVSLFPRRNIKKIYVEITGRCNLNCRMCYRRSWRESPGDMPEDTFRALMEQLGVFTGIKEMVLGGIGEPLFNPRFGEMLDAAAGLKLDLTITTNGTLLDSAAIESILRNRVSRLVISVDSPEEETFTSIRQSALSRILENQRVLTERRKLAGMQKLVLAWEFVVMESNYRHLPELVKLASETGVEELFVSHLMPLEYEATKEIMYGREKFEDLEKVFKKAANTALARGIRIVLPRSLLKTERRCRFVESDAVAVAWNGDVVPCYRFLHSYREYVSGRPKDVTRHSFGNIKAGTLEEIWTSGEYSAFRYMVKNSLYPSCTDCELVDGCDTAARTEYDCMGNIPACGDCLWARGIVFCP